MELIYAPVTEIAAAIRTKKVSALAVTTACLERIKAVNPQLNAVVALAEEAALQEASAADARLDRAGPQGPLHGVPMTIKDSFDTAGIVSTWGTPGRADHVPKTDATIVSRLKAAGAILLGKSNTPEFTLNFETNNPVYGRTSNPYNLERSSGGSSGGAAAVVAAGGAPFDIGTDTGGSIRQPAHFCGLAGIKPTTGRVPRTGHAIGPGALVDQLTQVGPLTRSVADLILLLPLIAGPDGHDPFISPVAWRDPSAVSLPELRLGFYTDNGICSPIPAIATAVRQAAAALAELGVDVTESLPPGMAETTELMPALFDWDGGIWLRLLLERAGTSVTESSLARARSKKEAAPADVIHLIDRWDAFRRRLLEYMADFDILLAPVNATTAIPHGTLREHYDGFSYTLTYNLTGWPAAVVRIGETEGLPIGVQIIGQPWREDVVLAVASQLEQIFGGWQVPPL